MSLTDTAPHPASNVAEIREKIMPGLATVPAFSKAANISVRTVRTYVTQGLPVTFIGHRMYVQIQEGGEWLRSRHSPKNQTPTRGRPRKAA